MVQEQLRLTTFVGHEIMLKTSLIAYVCRSIADRVMPVMGWEMRRAQKNLPPGEELTIAGFEGTAQGDAKTGAKRPPQC
eukprot:CAMPEP_0196809820 /NCGR_PEP_ID=MMETSP1362-20130617/9704_1 /TAXON_ID=163516 /ORGANISM="Leptocylindrus danicus, Strain CCMP1856" /LENGTH=78 /DNA_ID=CAMNT_0042184617 /DNA_START=88 /DNA_END=321 /DNA_ORIENTATION=+